MSARKPTVRGFGYQADRSNGYHFEVKHAASGDVTIVERLTPPTMPDEAPYRATPPVKVTLRADRWGIVESAVAGEFNARLRQAGLRAGSWAKSATPLAPHFGKELVLLAWAIEGEDQTTIPRMLANWRGLAPEERWWFYTTINAASRNRGAGHPRGQADRPAGWRAAIRIAFLEEPRDIGLESLRLDAPVGDAADPPDPPEASGTPPARSPDPGPAQGRLFAEPDTPPYHP